MKVIRLWEGPDGLVVLQEGRKPPQPGPLYAVEASGRTEAERLVRLTRQPEPDRRKDPEGWAHWLNARESVSEVAQEPEAEEPKAEAPQGEQPGEEE